MRHNLDRHDGYIEWLQKCSCKVPFKLCTYSSQACCVFVQGGSVYALSGGANEHVVAELELAGWSRAQILQVRGTGDHRSYGKKVIELS